MRELASIAYTDKRMAEENCLLAFLRGVSNMEMRVKLNEAVITDFDDAVKLAKKIERVERTLKSNLEQETQKGDLTAVSDLNSTFNSKFADSSRVDQENLNYNYNHKEGYKVRVNQDDWNSNYTDLLGVKRSRKSGGDGKKLWDCPNNGKFPNKWIKNSGYFPSNQKFSDKTGEYLLDFPINDNFKNLNGKRSWDTQNGRKFSKNFNPNFRARKSHKIFRCWTCGKIGHKAVNCWYKISEENGTSHDFGPNRGLKRQKQDLN